MLTHTGPTTQLGEGLLISLHIAGPYIIYSPIYLGCQEQKKVFSIDQLQHEQQLTSSVWGAAPDYLYWYSYIAWWVMENGEEWRAEDISSPIRFCVWLTKTKKEYICTTIS